MVPITSNFPVCGNSHQKAMVPKGVFNIKIAVENKSFVDDVPMQNGDFTQQTVSLPEGIYMPFGNQTWLENPRTSHGGL